MDISQESVSSNSANNQNQELPEYTSMYVYGIVDGSTTKEFDVNGIGNRSDRIHCIQFKDVTAIVSLTPFMEYDPTEDNTIAHEKVIQEILKHDLTIAPMRFCTVLKNEEGVRKLLYSAYMPFKRNILRVRNRREFSVKVFLNIPKLLEEVKDGDELVTKSREIATGLHETLKPIADDVALEEQITDEMIMNCSFLLHKDKIPKFYEAITEFDKRFTDKLKVRISGPTAPYNFVNMPTK
jgi:hypothetical protein